MRIEDQRRKWLGSWYAPQGSPYCYGDGTCRIHGKLGEYSDANAGSRALCPNFRPKKVWLKIRTNFHVFGCFIIIYHFMVYKMCYRFPSVVSKLPLQKGDEPSGSSFVRALNPKSDHWNGFVRTFTQFTTILALLFARYNS